MRGALLALIVACGPTPTGTPCADPDPITGTTTLTWDNFGKNFFATYCTMCHSVQLLHSQRNGAPIYHDFDTLELALQIKLHTDEQAGWGPDAKNSLMPGNRCPETPGGPLAMPCVLPSGEERTQLAQWLACEEKRDHHFVHDAGVD